MFQSSLGGTMTGSHNPAKDHEILQPPEDSISALKFSPNSNYLVASSWNDTVSTDDIALAL